MSVSRQMLRGEAREAGSMETSVKRDYLDMIRLIERLHRRFLDVIKTELDRLGVEDINNVQTLILSNIGQEQLTVGELTARGYYLGSNVSYNVKKLVENGYLQQERSPHDRRMTRVRLSRKGLDLCDKVDQLYEDHAARLERDILGQEQFADTKEVLGALERFWTSCITYAR